MDTPTHDQPASGSPSTRPQTTGRLASGCGAALGGVLVIALIVGVFLFNPLGPGLWWHWQAETERQSAEAARQSASLESAREIANVFLDAVRNEDGSSAYALLSTDFRGRLSREESKSKKMDVAVVKGQRITDYKVEAGKLSDNKERASFEGFVKTKDSESHSYRLVIVKESAGFWKGSSWRVDLFTIQQ
jgi:hypothetical protein